MSNTHTCPVRGCETKVDNKAYVCLRHWKMTQARERQAINHAFFTFGVGSAELRAAQSDLLDIIHSRLETETSE